MKVKYAKEKAASQPASRIPLEIENDRGKAREWK